MSMTSALLEQARALSPGDQLELVEALWNEIANHRAIPLPTDAQRDELERRLADHHAHPEDTLPWEAAKALALEKLKARSER
jgi:putative addiction module component (TIGR02574 family)